MDSDRRQQLLDQFDEIMIELFADGLGEASDITQHLVLHGLDKKRVNIAVNAMVSPVAPTRLLLGIVSPDRKEWELLFQIDSTKHKPIVITPLSGGSDAVQ